MSSTLKEKHRCVDFAELLLHMPGLNDTVQLWIITTAVDLEMIQMGKSITSHHSNP